MYSKSHLGIEFLFSDSVPINPDLSLVNYARVAVVVSMCTKSDIQLHSYGSLHESRYRKFWTEEHNSRLHSGQCAFL